MINDILSAIPLGFFLSIMPGAVFFVLLETSVIKGFRAAVAFDTGAILSDIIFIAVAYFSSYRLIQSIKDEPALFVFGGLIMITYGIISFIKVHRAGKTDIIEESEKEILKKNYLSLFIKGFLLNFINVGVLGFWLAILITWGPQLDMVPSRMLTFFAGVITAYFVTDLFKIMLAKQLRKKLTVKNIGMVKKTISIILILFGLALSIQGWFPAKGEKMIDDTINKLEHSNQ